MASKKLLEGERWEVEADGRDDILPVASKRGYMVRTHVGLNQVESGFFDETVELIRRCVRQQGYGSR